MNLRSMFDDPVSWIVVAVVVAIVFVCMAVKMNRPLRPREGPDEADAPGTPKRQHGSLAGPDEHTADRCPLIGAPEDVQMRWQEPTSRQVCHAHKGRRGSHRVSKEHQARLCLTPEHVSCEKYQEGDG